jgi:hypothetical protein
LIDDSAVNVQEKHPAMDVMKPIPRLNIAGASFLPAICAISDLPPAQCASY